MSIDLSTMVNDLRSHIGVKSNHPEFSDDACKLLLNRAFWDMLNKIDFKEKEVSATFQTEAGTYFYTLPIALEALLRVSAVTEQGQHVIVMKSDTFTYESKQDDTVTGFPTMYVHHDSGIILHPTPDAAYTIWIYYLYSLEDLDFTNLTSTGLPRNTDEMVLYGGIYRGFLKLKDFQSANVFLSLYDKAIVEFVNPERKGNDDKFAGVDVMRPEYRL